MPKRLTNKEFIEKARGVHESFYIYDKTNYINNFTKVEIKCPLHGYFLQRPSDHLSGSGCPQCARINRAKKQSKTQKDFIKQAKSIHHNKYDYKLVNYISRNKEVEIFCKKHNESFYQKPSNHLDGCGCPKCGMETKSNGRIKPYKTFLKQAKEIHGNKYQYIKSSYINDSEKMSIICPDHGEFRQSPNSHLRGKGCPQCKPYKILQTKKKNKTVSFSNPELYLHRLLVKKFGTKEVEPQYNRDARYPFACDFYIKSRDLFIEYNGNWTHQDHWYNENSLDDQDTLASWSEKNSEYYNSAIKTWTSSDIKKQSFAKNNSLNYVVLWTETDIDEWFDLDCPDGHDGDGMRTWKGGISNV